jgi:hypothetical protein
MEGKKLTNELTGTRWTVLNEKYEHLRDLPLQDVEREPDLLLGLDHTKLLAPQAARTGKLGEPIAELTLLGWAAKGPLLMTRALHTFTRESRPIVNFHFLEREEKRQLLIVSLTGKCWAPKSNPRLFGRVKTKKS